jgi:hypothetical protein
VPQTSNNGAALQFAEKDILVPAFGLKKHALAFGWRSRSPPLHLLLGGAAVYRCDKRPVLNAGFSRWGHTLYRVIKRVES